MSCQFWDKDAETVAVFNSTYRYLDNLLNIDYKVWSVKFTNQNFN